MFFYEPSKWRDCAIQPVVERSRTDDFATVRPCDRATLRSKPLVERSQNDEFAHFDVKIPFERVVHVHDKEKMQPTQFSTQCVYNLLIGKNLCQLHTLPQLVQRSVAQSQSRAILWAANPIILRMFLSSKPRFPKVCCNFVAGCDKICLPYLSTVGSDLRNIRYILQPHFAVGGRHFQSVTICNGFIPLIF